jgi:short-subunit dehydrogenase
VLTARRQEALDEVARECEAFGGPVMTIAGDVSEPVVLERVARRAVERFQRIDVWVNNAAVTTFGRFLDTPLGEIRRVIDVNVMGYVHGARAALPHMRRQESGVLVNVASIVSAVAQPYASAYSMSKFAVRALGASLRQELRLDGIRGVRVCTVMPAAIDTPLFDEAGNHTRRRVKAMPPVYAPERVARTIVNLVRAPRREVVVGPLGRMIVMQSKFAPGLTERLMAIQVDRTHLDHGEPAPDTQGNLFEPESGTGSVHGGWNGKKRTALRRAATAGAVAAGGLVGARRLVSR